MAEADRVTEGNGAGSAPPITHYQMTGHTMAAVAVAPVAILATMLLSGALRVCASACILLSVALFVTIYRFEVDPLERRITIRTLWWGRCERRAVTYAFDDVRGLRYAPFGEGYDGYRWEFRDGATYHLMAPVDGRLLRWFRGERNKTWEASQNRMLKLGLFAGFLLCTAVSLGFDVFVGRDIMRQAHSRSYSRVTGHLLRTSVKPRDDGSSLWNFEPDVKYSYVVNGVEYVGTRLRYIHPGTGGFSESASRALLPKGELASVHFNPLDPADAILSPGLVGRDLFTLLCLLPFNAVVILGTIAGVHRARFRAIAGVPVWHDGRNTRAGLRRGSPAAAATLAAGVVAVVLVFAIGIPTGGNPSMAIAALGWLLVVCAAATACRASVDTLTNGTGDLVIDLAHRTLTLPAADGRREPLTIPWESLSEIEVEDTQDKSPTVHYAVVAVVTHADGTKTRARLSDPQIELSASALADWVRGIVCRYPPARPCHANTLG